MYNDYLEEVDDGGGVEGVPVVGFATVHEGLELPRDEPAPCRPAEYLIQLILTDHGYWYFSNCLY